MSATLADLVTPRLSPLVPHWPHPPQAAFLLVDHIKEVLYGGAAGGGKSDALLMAALAYAHVPGYSAIIFRRTYPQLSAADGLILRSQEWLAGKPGCVWNEARHRWTFASGATLTFSHLQRETSVYDHQGAAYQMIGFDELTHFAESQYRYMLSRLRRPKGMQVPLRVRSTANPGGVGHAWVKARFVSSSSSKDRLFIPARLADNPSLGDDYRANLELLSDLERRRLLHGDWDVEAGDIFNRNWFRVAREAPPNLRWVRFWDLAASSASTADQTATIKAAIDKDGNLYLADGMAGRWEWPEARRRFVQVALSEPGVAQNVEAIASWRVAVDDLRSMPQLAGVALKGVTYPPGMRDKVSRALPLAARAEARKVVLVDGPWISDFLDQIVGFRADMKHSHDDWVDAATGALYCLSGNNHLGRYSAPPTGWR